MEEAQRGQAASVRVPRALPVQPTGWVRAGPRTSARSQLSDVIVSQAVTPPHGEAAGPRLVLAFVEVSTAAVFSTSPSRTPQSIRFALPCPASVTAPVSATRPRIPDPPCSPALPPLCSVPPTNRPDRCPGDVSKCHLLVSLSPFSLRWKCSDGFHCSRVNGQSPRRPPTPDSAASVHPVPLALSTPALLMSPNATLGKLPPAIPLRAVFSLPEMSVPLPLSHLLLIPQNPSRGWIFVFLFTLKLSPFLHSSYHGPELRPLFSTCQSAGPVEDRAPCPCGPCLFPTPRCCRSLSRLARSRGSVSLCSSNQCLFLDVYKCPKQ